MAHVPTIHYSSIVREYSMSSPSVLLTKTDSGHGGQTKDLDGDEEDGYDEGDNYRLPI